MHRRVFLVLISILLLGSVVEAQPHTTGYVAGSHSGKIFLVDPLGGVQTAHIGQDTFYGLTMDVDNHLIVACHYRDEVLRIDPVSRTVVGTLYKGIPLRAVRDITIDHNGDYFVTDSILNGVLRITPNGQINTVRLDSYRMESPYGGIGIDVYSGELLVLDIAYDDALLRVYRDGSRLETVGTGFSGRYGLAQHIPTGDVYAGSGGGLEGSIHLLKPFRKKAEVFASYNSGPTGMLALAIDRASAREQRLIGTGMGASSGIWYVDCVTTQATRFAQFSQDTYEVEFLRGRNLQTVRTQRGLYEVRLSFLDSPVRAYILAASLGGPGPALMTPDGRSVNLAPDPLFWYTLQHELAPWLTGNHGTLNLLGEAKARLDLRGFGSNLNGTRIWLAALVLDPAAPSGILTISDPYPFVVEGL